MAPLTPQREPDRLSIVTALQVSNQRVAMKLRRINTNKKLVNAEATNMGHEVYVRARAEIRAPISFGVSYLMGNAETFMDYSQPLLLSTSKTPTTA